ncbi:hypothetical protein [Reichenbachiella versicolor]|uniref:hypothetical protein n=1 Tax=Reichenbachiella versicolor TaxID=1821036 RepID=UPI000D6E5EA9|nr:hypothetical protein [Reichenbachiella versicolor]
MPINWIKEGEKDILYVDLSGISDQVILIGKSELAFEEVSKSPHEKTLILLDFTNTSLGPDFMAIGKERVAEILAEKNVKTAMIGITGLKRVLFKGYQTFTSSKAVLFDLKEQALDYLSQD